MQPEQLSVFKWFLILDSRGEKIPNKAKDLFIFLLIQRNQIRPIQTKPKPNNSTKPKPNQTTTKSAKTQKPNQNKPQNKPPKPAPPTNQPRHFPIGVSIERTPTKIRNIF